MTTTLTKPAIYKCRCGRLTEWDFELGDEPLCVKCWDRSSEKVIDNKVAAGQRAYREANKEKVAMDRSKGKSHHKYCWNCGNASMVPNPERGFICTSCGATYIDVTGEGKLAKEDHGVALYESKI